MSVDDGRECLFIANVDGATWALTGPEFLADPLVDEHVRVDGHADGQSQASDAGQGHCRAKRREDRDLQEQVEHDREVSDHTGHVIVKCHEHQHERGPGERPVDALTNGVGAEARSDALLVRRRDGGGEGT